MPVLTQPTIVQDSRETFANLETMTPGRRHLYRCRRDGYMTILPFGPENTYAHVFFYEQKDGQVVDSAILLPETVRELAVDGLPINHLERRSAPTLSAAARSGDTAEDVKKAVQEATSQEPAEARPDEKDPEAIQSPVEAEIFNQLKSKELVETTLASVFGDNGVKIEPGNLVDGTYLDEEKTLPIREIIYFVTREGRPILHSYFNVFYDVNKLPTMIITRSVESIESKFYRKVVVEQTQKSSSFSAGLTLGLSSPTNFVSSGPAPGDPVQSKGKPLQGAGGTTFGFNASFTKTYNRLRIEAELDVQDKLGTFVTTVTRIPPVGG